MEYRSHVAPTVEKFSGRYLVRCGPFEVVEGTYQPVRLAMLEFPSMDQARSWYDSQEYRELKQIRLAATVSNGFFMTGAPRVTTTEIDPGPTVNGRVNG